MINLILSILLPKAFALVGILLLGRILSTIEMGVVGLYISVIAVLSPLLSGRLVLFYTRAKNQEEFTKLFDAGNRISVFIILLCSPFAGLYLSNQATTSMWFVSALIVLIWLYSNHLKEALEHTFLRSRSYRLVRNRNLVIGFFVHLLRVSAALISATGVFVSFINAITQGILSFLYAYKNKIIDLAIFDVKKYKESLSTYLSFGFSPIVTTITQFISAFIVQAPIFLSNHFFTREETGLVAMFFLTIMLPLKAIFQGVGKFIFAELSAHLRDPRENIGKDKLLIACVLLPASALVVYMIGPILELFLIPIIGKEWEGMIVIYNSMIFLLIAQLAQTGTGLIFKATRSENLNLALNVVRVLGIAYIMTTTNALTSIQDFFSTFSLILGTLYLISYFISLYKFFKYTKNIQSSL